MKCLSSWCNLYEDTKVMGFQHSNTISAIKTGILTLGWQRSESAVSSSKLPQKVDLSLTSLPLPWSSLLIKNSQVRGWRVNTGVSAWISMGGMNYSRPAPIIYFTSAGERQQSSAAEKPRCKANWHLSLFLITLSDSFMLHVKFFKEYIHHMSPHRADP